MFQSQSLADLLGLYWKREIPVCLLKAEHISLQTCTHTQFIKLTEDIHCDRHKYVHKCPQQGDSNNYDLAFVAVYVYKYGDTNYN